MPSGGLQLYVSLCEVLLSTYWGSDMTSVLNRSIRCIACKLTLFVTAFANPVIQQDNCLALCFASSICQ